MLTNFQGKIDIEPKYLSVEHLTAAQTENAVHINRLNIRMLTKEQVDDVEGFLL